MHSTTATLFLRRFATKCRADTLACLAFVPILLAACSASESAEPRPLWTTSRIVGSPKPPLPYVTERVYADVKLVQPTAMVPVPKTDRMIVTQLENDIVSFDRKDAVRSFALALDLSHAHPEFYQALGITFHPDFPDEPWCYVTYQLREHGDHGVRLVRFRATDPTVPRLDPNSELLLATWRNHGHRGGGIAFGPDGYLYVPIGDGNPPSPPDPLHTGQDLRDLQSSILRIDVAATTREAPYRVPPDNPFVDLAGARGEVWAYGFRNPWKICFDPKTGSLWTGDVGWELMEMVHRVEKGGNYGWSVMEGSQPVHLDGMVGPTPIQPPVVEHTHVEARSVTGGFFYYGDRLPDLDGAYLYGDYMTGKIWALRHDGTKLTWHQEIADTPFQIISFALEPDGEIDVIGFDGTLHRLVPNPRAQHNVEFPRKLSETGLFGSTRDLQPAPGVLSYTINAEHWADHTSVERLVALPGDAQLDVYAEDNWEVGQNEGHVAFPQDAVLAKTIVLEMVVGDASSRRRLETQILHRDGDSWNAYNYVWNDDQADAELLGAVGRDQAFQIQDPNVPGGIRPQVWHHASQNECLLCHIWRAGTVHGFKLGQLNRSDLDGINQLTTLREAGLFRDPLSDNLDRQISPSDVSATLEQRARAYLHLNCSHCHRDGGGGTASFDLRQQLPLDETRLINAAATQGTFGIADGRIVVPGQPHKSILLYRLAKLGRGHMPQFGSHLADAAGINLIDDWIESLGGRQESKTAADDQQLLRQLTFAEPTASDSIIKQLLDSTSGSLTLALAINDGSIANETAAAVVRQAAQNRDGTVRDLFERFLPADQRIQRLGASFDVNALLNQRGDAERGRELFFRGIGVECRNCHQVGEIGGLVGPSLDGVGAKYRPGEILENIMTPSRKIDPKYLAYYVETTAGRVYSGLLISQNEAEVIVRDATAKDHAVPQSEIALMQPQQKSLMPEQLFRDFTAQQAADMLAFLSSLTEPPTAQRFHSTDEGN